MNNNANFFNYNTNNEAVNMLSNTNGMSYTAHLYLFRPRILSPQFKRPYQYNFNNEIIDAVKNTVEHTISNPAQNTYLNSFMYQYPETNNMIIPSAQGNPLNLSRINNYWSFILIIDKFNPHQSVGVRMLYSGYCLDEPVHDANTGHGIIYNPGCALQITHHTEIVTRINATNLGPEQYVDVFSDVDVLNPLIMTVEQQDPNLKYMLRPEDARKCIDDSYTDNDEYQNTNNDNQMISLYGDASTEFTESEYTQTINPSSGYLNTMQGNLVIPSTMNSPKHHGQKIIKSMVDSIDSLWVGQYSSASVTDCASGIGYGDNYQSAVQLFDNQLCIRPNNSQNSDIDLNINYLTIDMLKNKYPNMQIVAGDAPNMNYNIKSQQDITPSNIYSSVVSSALPSIMANCGITDIAFWYNSYYDRKPEMVGSGFELKNIATFTKASGEELAYKWNALVNLIKRTLFPIIMASNHGDFDLLVSSSVAGNSFVQLNFIDHPIVNAAYETNNLLGATNTPLLGGEYNLMHNATQLNNAFHNVYHQTMTY